MRRVSIGSSLLSGEASTNSNSGISLGQCIKQTSQEALNNPFQSTSNVFLRSDDLQDNFSGMDSARASFVNSDHDLAMSLQRTQAMDDVLEKDNDLSQRVRDLLDREDSIDQQIADMHFMNARTMSPISFSYAQPMHSEANLTTNSQCSFYKLLPDSTLGNSCMMTPFRQGPDGICDDDSSPVFTQLMPVEDVSGLQLPNSTDESPKISFRSLPKVHVHSSGHQNSSAKRGTLKSLNTTNSTEYGDLPSYVDIPEDIIQNLNSLRMTVDRLKSSEDESKLDQNIVLRPPFGVSTLKSVNVSADCVTSHAPHEIYPPPYTFGGEKGTVSALEELPISGDMQFHSTSPEPLHIPANMEKHLQLKTYIDSKSCEPDSASQRLAAMGSEMFCGNDSISNNDRARNRLHSIATERDMIDALDTLSKHVLDSQGNAEKKAFDDGETVDETPTNKALLAQVRSLLNRSASKQYTGSSSPYPEFDEIHPDNSLGVSSVDSLAMQVKQLLEEEISNHSLALDEFGNDGQGDINRSANLSSVLQEFEDTDLWKYVCKFLPSANCDGTVKQKTTMENEETRLSSEKSNNVGYSSSFTNLSGQVIQKPNNFENGTKLLHTENELCQYGNARHKNKLDLNDITCVASGVASEEEIQFCTPPTVVHKESSLQLSDSLVKDTKNPESIVIHDSSYIEKKLQSYLNEQKSKREVAQQPHDSCKLPVSLPISDSRVDSSSEGSTQKREDSPSLLLTDALILSSLPEKHLPQSSSNCVPTLDLKKKTENVSNNNETPQHGTSGVVDIANQQKEKEDNNKCDQEVKSICDIKVSNLCATSPTPSAIQSEVETIQLSPTGDIAALINCEPHISNESVAQSDLPEKDTSEQDDDINVRSYQSEESNNAAQASVPDEKQLVDFKPKSAYFKHTDSAERIIKLPQHPSTTTNKSYPPTPAFDPSKFGFRTNIASSETSEAIKAQDQRLNEERRARAKVIVSRSLPTFDQLMARLSSTTERIKETTKLAAEKEAADRTRKQQRARATEPVATEATPQESATRSQATSPFDVARSTPCVTASIATQTPEPRRETTHPDAIRPSCRPPSQPIVDNRRSLQPVADDDSRITSPDDDDPEFPLPPSLAVFKKLDDRLQVEVVKALLRGFRRNGALPTAARRRSQQDRSPQTHQPDNFHRPEFVDRHVAARRGRKESAKRSKSVDLNRTEEVVKRLLDKIERQRASEHGKSKKASADIEKLLRRVVAEKYDPVTVSQNRRKEKAENKKRILQVTTKASSKDILQPTLTLKQPKQRGKTSGGHYPENFSKGDGINYGLNPAQSLQESLLERRPDFIHKSLERLRKISHNAK